MDPRGSSKVPRNYMLINIIISSIISTVGTDALISIIMNMNIIVIGAEGHAPLQQSLYL